MIFFIRKFLHEKRSQSLIELLIVIALLGVILPAISLGLISSREGKPQQERRSRAVEMIKETSEALRSIREVGWSYIETNGVFHTVHNGSTWSLSSDPETINGITKQIEISNVSRDVNNQIVESGGTLDPSTKKIQISISWTTPLTGLVESTQYLTRYLDNATYIQTTEADFNSGTNTGTIVTSTDGGEVTLGSGGQGSWCSPSFTIASLDLPKNGVANAITAIEGKAFAATGDNASGVSFANVVISNTSPPIASIRSTFDGYKTNDIFGETNYAYLATDTNDEEIVILDLTGESPSKVGYFNASGSTNADAVFISGNVGYMIQGSTLRTFNLTNKSGSRAQLGSIALAGTGNSLYVVGSHIYVVVNNASNELQIVDASNPSSLSITSSTNLPTSNVSDVFVNESGTRGYVSAGASDASQKEGFILDVTSKTGSRPILGSVDTGAMSPRGITVVPGNKMIIVGVNGEEYQVFDIASESNPSHCGGIEADLGIFDVASVLEADGDAYSYIVSGDSSAELKIIQGGPGGTYSSSGVYESATFDLGYSTAFNRLSPTFIKPANTEIRFQVAVADPTGGSCTGATFEFVGPDKTTTSYFTAEELIPFDNNATGYENPARCFRYRTYLSTTDSSSTPIFEAISINYSP